MTPPLTHDRNGGLLGLLVGAVLLLIVLYSIVRLTNAHYGRSEAARPAAQASQ